MYSERFSFLEQLDTRPYVTHIRRGKRNLLLHSFTIHWYIVYSVRICHLYMLHVYMIPAINITSRHSSVCMLYLWFMCMSYLYYHMYITYISHLYILYVYMIPAINITSRHSFGIFGMIFESGVNRLYCTICVRSDLAYLHLHVFIHIYIIIW